MRWLDSITDSMDMNLSKLWERQWRTDKPGVLQSRGLQKVGHDLATEQGQKQEQCLQDHPFLTATALLPPPNFDGSHYLVYIFTISVCLPKQRHLVLPLFRLYINRITTLAHQISLVAQMVKCLPTMRETWV